MGVEQAVQLSDTDRRDWLWMAGFITIAAYGVPFWVGTVVYFALSPSAQSFIATSVGFDNYRMCFELLFGLALALSSPARSGLCWGEWQSHRRGLLAVCGLPIFVTALVYPQLAERPFANAEIGMWLISPVAQDLVFIGYLYGRLDSFFPAYIHPKVPLRRTLVVASIYFAAWHLPGIVDGIGFTLFQLVYCFAGSCLVGLARQWTGSILPVTLTHIACNFIAWVAH